MRKVRKIFSMENFDMGKLISNRRRYLTKDELEKLIKAGRKGRYGRRDATLGLQAGYNWQFSSQWVAGVETDFDWSDIKGTGTSNFKIGGGPTSVGVPSNFTVSQDVKWF